MRLSSLLVVAAVLGACGSSSTPPDGGAGGGVGGGSVATGGGDASGGGSATGGGAAASRDELTGGSRLKTRALVGTDGSRQQVGFFDTSRNENCTFQGAADGTTRCLPSGLTSGAYFLDVGCNQPVFYRSSTDCNPPPTYALRSVTTACKPGFEVHQLGPALATTPGALYFATESGCISTTPISNVTYFPSVAVVPATDFVQATVMVE